MHTDHDPIDPEELLKLGYEHRDVRAKPMAWAAFWLFVFTIGSGLLALMFIRIWNIVPEVPVEQRHFGAAANAVHPPLDTPIIQNNSDNTADIATLRAKEAKAALEKVDLHDGSYRIPIDVALQMIVQRGLPKTGTLSVSHPTLSPKGEVVNPVGNPPMPGAASGSTGNTVPDHGMPKPTVPPAASKQPANASGAKKQ